MYSLARWRMARLPSIFFICSFAQHGCAGKLPGTRSLPGGLTAEDAEGKVTNCRRFNERRQITYQNPFDFNSMHCPAVGCMASMGLPDYPCTQSGFPASNDLSCQKHSGPCPNRKKESVFALMKKKKDKCCCCLGLFKVIFFIFSMDEQSSWINNHLRMIVYSFQAS